MAFILRRCFSTTACARHLMKPTVAIPAPMGQQSLLETAELQQLAQKAKGPWKNLEKEEMVQLYRASFPQTFQEMKAGGDSVKVITGVVIGIIAGISLGQFLSKTVGPERPPTLYNAEWEAATREKLIRQKANPISGISSKVTSN